MEFLDRLFKEVSIIDEKAFEEFKKDFKRIYNEEIKLKKLYSDRLMRVTDELCKEILEMTDEEVIKEAKERGEDPKIIAKEVQNIIDSVLEEHK